MDLREQGLSEIYERVKAQAGSIGLEGFLRSPTKPVTDYPLPCVFMDEGVDEVTKPSARNRDGYPCNRMLEVILEIAAKKDSTVSIKQLYRNVRSVVFAGGPEVAEGTFIRELRAEGPTGYGLPDMIGMRLVLALFYLDDGT